MNYYDGITNMALDEVIRNYSATKGIPVVRFYGWNPPAVSIGHQQLLRDIDVAQCNSYGLDIVRRFSGGGAVIHGYGLTYSIAVPVTMFPLKEIEAASTSLEMKVLRMTVILHKAVTNLIVSSLKSLGVKALVEHGTDIIVGDRKISGSAVYHDPSNSDDINKIGAWLMHGEIFYDLVPEMWRAVYRLSEKKLASSMISVKAIDASLTLDGVCEAFTSNFLWNKDPVQRDFSKSEIKSAEKIAERIRERLFEEGRTYISRGACPANWRKKRRQKSQQPVRS